MGRLRILIAALLFGLAAACSGSDVADPSPLPTVTPVEDASSLFPSAGDATAGIAVFLTSCSGCHSTGTGVLIGPGLGGIAGRAATRTQLSAEEYLRQLIKEPSAFGVEGFPGVPDEFADLTFHGSNPAALIPLSDTDIDNLVAFLLTLE